MEEQITISVKEYEELVDDQLKLNCLQGAGVDNWEGYDLAIEEYQSIKEESIK